MFETFTTTHEHAEDVQPEVVVCAPREIETKDGGGGGGGVANEIDALDDWPKRFVAVTVYENA